MWATYKTIYGHRSLFYDCPFLLHFKTCLISNKFFIRTGTSFIFGFWALCIQIPNFTSTKCKAVFKSSNFYFWRSDKSENLPNSSLASYHFDCGSESIHANRKRVTWRRCCFSKGHRSRPLRRTPSGSGAELRTKAPSVISCQRLNSRFARANARELEDLDRCCAPNTAATQLDRLSRRRTEGESGGGWKVVGFAGKGRARGRPQTAGP